MSLYTPSPAPSVCRFPEHAEKIPFGISNHGPAFFQLVKNGFEAHDRGCLFVAFGARAGFEKLQGGLSLFGVHICQRQSFASGFPFLVLERDEMPVNPLL